MKMTEGQKQLCSFVKNNLEDIRTKRHKEEDFDLVISREKVLRHLAKLYRELDVTLNEDNLAGMFMQYREFGMAKDRYEILDLKYYLHGAFISLLETRTTAEDTLEWCMRLFDTTWFRPLIDEMKDSNYFPELRLFYKYGRDYVDRDENWVEWGNLYEYTIMGGEYDPGHQFSFDRLQKEHETALDMLIYEGRKSL
jgi:hypothetical protein